MTLTETHFEAGGPPATTPRRPGRRSQPVWRRPTASGWIVAAIGVLTSALYTWNLAAAGWANGYYAAAVRAASVSWKAFFFGAIDPGSFITVDKPPAALWLMGLSARIFGFSSWSVLLPQAACGVASVLLLHNLVRRWSGDAAAHLAALAFALTPVAALMFRFNNPDALLTFLMLAAAWALWRALESGRTRWLVATGALVGLAFETKMLQALLVLPALGLAYLWAGPPRLRRRIGQLLAGGAAMVAAAGWWVAIVALWPASSRPFIGSTTDNSILSLIFGYNGLSRIFGGDGPGGGRPPGMGRGAAIPAGGARLAGGPGGPGGGFGGAPGWLRMFNPIVGGQISWLIPLALLGLVAGLALTFRARRTDHVRAGWLLWGGWALVTIAVFSLSKGIFHPYYTVALAPAIAALAGAGAVALWRLAQRSARFRWVLPVAILGSAIWAASLLQRTPTYAAWLRPSVVLVAAVGALGVCLAAFGARGRVTLAGGAVAATVALLAGPTAFTLTTVRHPAGGALASAGPVPSGAGGFRFGGPMGGATPGTVGRGSPGEATVDTALVSYLERNQGTATYLAAAFGSQSSAGLIIASGKPVITIGGFNGGDPAPTLSQFQKLVSAGKVRYVLMGGDGPGAFGADGPRRVPGRFEGGPPSGPGGPGRSSAINEWVTAHGTAVPPSAYGGTGGASLYDLAASRRSAE